MLGFLSSILSGSLGAIVNSVAGVFSNAKTVESAEFAAMTAAEKEEYVAALRAQTDLNTAKGANAWWGAHLMVLLFGIPPALHMGAVYVDAAFFGGGHIKSVPPAYADAEFKIALSFFLLAPALTLGAPIASSLAQRLRTRS